MTLLIWAAMPLTPILLYRPGERLLRLAETGVTVDLGGRVHTTPWRSFTQVTESDAAVVMYGRRYNALMIADAAFGSGEAREAFVRAARDYIARTRH